MASEDKSPSILLLALRTFFKTVAVMAGIGLGFLPLVLMASLGSAASLSQQSLPSSSKIEVLPNATGKRETLKADSPLILQVNLEGLIGVRDLSQEKFEQLLSESQEGALKDGRVKAILLNINSPGGTLFGSDAFYRLLEDYKERYQIPVYAFTDGICASGAFYLALAADKIYATKVGLVGSVGVILPSSFNVRGLMDKLGVDSRTLLAGKHKDAMNPFRTWDENEGRSYQRIIDFAYDEFTSLVVQRRPQIDLGKLKDEYGAEVFMGVQAQEVGYIDEVVRDRHAAIKALAAAANLGDNYQVIQLKSKSLWSEMFNLQAWMPPFKVTHEFNLGPVYDPELRHMPLCLYSPGA